MRKYRTSESQIYDIDENFKEGIEYNASYLLSLKREDIKFVDENGQEIDLKTGDETKFKYTRIKNVELTIIYKFKKCNY